MTTLGQGEQPDTANPNPEWGPKLDASKYQPTMDLGRALLESDCIYQHYPSRNPHNISCLGRMTVEVEFDD